MVKLRCQTDVELFAKLFFPHHCRHRFSTFHRRMFKNYQNSVSTPLLDRRGHGDATAAPRGNAKSTIKSLLIPIHAVVYQTERYIIIISATLKQATQRLDNIRTELLTNDKLKRMYGDFLEGKERWTKKSVIVNNVRIDAFSAGTEIRGIAYKEFRPTRIIVDDGEDSDKIENPDLRDKLSAWFCEVVENLGDSYTVIDVVGTMLHQESLLAELLKRPDYKSYLYRSVISFSPAQDLWNQWRDIYTNLADDKRLETANAFYAVHKKEMLKGTRVLWKAKEDYYDLMCQMVSHGRRAFFKEKQNDPRNADLQVFDSTRFKRFEIVGNQLRIGDGGATTVPLESLQICGFLDPALGHGRGTRKRGDYAAIATIGKDIHGYIYVLDVFLKRISPIRQIAAAFDLHMLWNYRSFGIETNCFQEMMLEPFEHEREKRREAGQAWALPLSEIKHHKKKETRILSIEPLVNNGWVLFNKNLPEEFFQQCEQFPTARHDDGLDALAAAIALAKTDRITKQSSGKRNTIRSLKGF